MAKKNGTKKKPYKDPRCDLNNKIIKEACVHARNGNFRYDIAKRLQISVLTWNSWLDRGRKRLEEIEKGLSDNYTIQCKLVEELEKAETEARCQLMEDVAQSSSDKVKLSFLKLRYGKYFADQQKVVDQDTGEERNKGASEILAEKLAAFLDKD